MSDLTRQQIEQKLRESTGASLSQQHSAPSFDLAGPLLSLQQSFNATFAPSREAPTTPNVTTTTLEVGGSGLPAPDGNNTVPLTTPSPAPVRLHFSVLQRRISGHDYWGCYFYCDLYKSSGDPTDLITVNGALTSITPDDTDTGWIEIGSLPDTMLLKGTIGTWPDLSDASIVTVGAGETFNNLIEYSTSGSIDTQSFFRCPIAKAYADADSKPFAVNLSVGAKILDLSTRMALTSGGGTPKPVPSVYPYPL